MLEMINRAAGPHLTHWIASDIEAARAALATADLDPEVAVHTARKRLKRVRSLLGALKGLDPDHHAARLDPVKAAFRALAGTRDADALLAAARWLVQHADGSAQDDAEHLVTRLRARIEALRLQPLPRDQISIDLDRARQALAALADRSPPADRVAGHLVDVYRKGRKCFHHALEEDAADEEALHDWRKAAKHWLYLGQVLADVKPAPKIYPLKELDRLTEYLGEEHDFANLARFVAADAGLPVDPQRIARLTQAITRRRAKLAGRAFELGRELYAEKPGRFAERL